MKLMSLLCGKKAAALVVAGLLATGSTIPAHAALVSYYLDQSNALPDGVNYLAVTIDDDGDPGEINFTVDALESALNPGSNFGIQRFAFNGPDLSGATLELPSGWSYDGSRNTSAFGTFLNVISGTGRSRQDPLVFSIGGMAGDTIVSFAASNAGGEYFAAHVADFTNLCETTSAYFAGTTPVPLPAAGCLFASGMLFVLARFRLRHEVA